MRLFTFTSLDFCANTYVIEQKNHLLCIDPACKEAEQKFSNDTPLTLVATHGHFDHILCAEQWTEKFKATLYAHPLDIPTIQDPYKNVSAYFEVEISYRYPLFPLAEGFWTEWQAHIWHLPGHSPGSIGLYFPEKGWFFGGDLLFRFSDSKDTYSFSVGRSDLPGGDESTLWKSVQRILSLLPDDTMVYPGHGEPFIIKDFRIYFQSREEHNEHPTLS